MKKQEFENKMKTYLEEFSNYAEKIIEKYVDKRNLLSPIIKDTIDIEKLGYINFINERTLASEITDSLDKEILTKLGVEDYEMISELTLNYSQDIDTDDIRRIDKEIDFGNSDKKDEVGKDNIFIPDAFLLIKKISGLSIKIPIFIEFKVVNKYSYINLAADYLKYKYYSNNSKKPSVFIYIEFQQKERGIDRSNAKYKETVTPTITYNAENNNNVQILNNTISELEMSKKASIYAATSLNEKKLNFKSQTSRDALKDYSYNSLNLLDANVDFEKFVVNEYFLNLDVWYHGHSILFASIVRNNFKKIDNLYYKTLNKIKNEGKLNEKFTEFHERKDEGIFITEDKFLNSDIADLT